MLTTDQIQAARAQLGVTPSTSKVSVDHASELDAAWGASSAKPSFTQRVGGDISKAGEQVYKAITGEGEFAGGSDITRGIQATGEAFKAVPQVATEFAPEPVRTALGKAGEVAGKAIGGAADVIGSNKQIQDFVTQHPEATSKLIDILKSGQSLGDISNTILGAEGVSKGVTAIGEKAGDVHSSISDFLTKELPSSPKETQSLTDKVRTYFAKEQVDPRLEASAKRIEDPASLYKDYAIQAQNAVKDVKADAPLAKVGENIGNAFDSVVKTRRAVGQQMADELSKVKDVPVNVAEAANKFRGEILQDGTATLKPEVADKMTSFDKEQLGNYAKELHSLGDNPTAEKVDAFLSRVPREMDLEKAAKNVTDVTNAERIIKGSLSDLRTYLTKDPQMANYAKARGAYSDLSNFLDEGSKHLGAKTQTGDYARDASVAKSSAESIISGGKKDWLVKLEGLTGYKALDDATLAIQAMKDAGDTRGMSLFKTLGESVAHPTGLTEKILGYVAKKAAGKVIGTPSQQTQAFLDSLKSSSSAE